MARCQLAGRRLLSAASLRWWVLALLIVLASSHAIADSRTTFLIDRLKSEDFRVRTNAALALGATNDDAAIPPLCGALADSNDVVRQAAAAALKRLGKPAGVPCMKARLGVEPSADVKLQITRAIEAIESGGTGTPPAVTAAKFYVAITIGNNNTGRDSARILSAITSKLNSLGGYQLAPPSESSDAARAVIARRNLKGYYLAVNADVSDTPSGAKALVRIAIFSYPGRDLLGEVSPFLVLPGVRRADSAADSALQATAEHAAEQFSQNFQ